VRDSRAKSAFLHITATSRLLRVLKRDNRALMTAAARAEAAAGFLLRATGIGQSEDAPADAVHIEQAA
jgi:antirestriction protein ArdC